jgi:tight adherence protein B
MERLFSPELLPITLVAGGLLVMLIVAVIMVVMRDSRDDVVAERLGQFAGRGQEEQKESGARQAIERIDEVVSKSERGGNIARDLARADLKLTVAEFIGFKLITALLGAGLGAFIGRADLLAQLAMALLGALLFSFIPNFYVRWRSGQRMKAFNDQLGDTITMMANALRGGYSFMMCLDMVSREAPSPTSSEFRRVVQEVGLGRTAEEALQNLLRRVPSDDLELLITAVNIQMEVGGNLAQILDTIGHTIRERVRIKGEIQTLTAQGRISAIVITLLPIGLAVFITLMNPDYMAPIFTFGMPPQAWCCLPVTSLAMIAMGYFAIMRIIDIEV